MSQFIILSGSVRKASFTRVISRKILTLFQKKTDSVDLIDLRDIPDQAFGIDSLEKDKLDSKTQEYLTKITEAKALFIVVPEYNGSYPGVLKHFIDLWEYPKAWDKKIISFVGVAGGQWGGLRPIDHLESIFSYRETTLYSKRTLIPNVYQEVKEGSISPTVLERLKKHVEKFHSFCESIH